MFKLFCGAKWSKETCEVREGWRCSLCTQVYSGKSKLEAGGGILPTRCKLCGNINVFWWRNKNNLGLINEVVLIQLLLLIITLSGKQSNQQSFLLLVSAPVIKRKCVLNHLYMYICICIFFYFHENSWCTTIDERTGRKTDCPKNYPSFLFCGNQLCLWVFLFVHISTKIICYKALIEGMNIKWWPPSIWGQAMSPSSSFPLYFIHFTCTCSCLWVLQVITMKNEVFSRLPLQLSLHSDDRYPDIYLGSLICKMQTKNAMDDFDYSIRLTIYPPPPTHTHTCAKWKTIS